MLLKLLWLVSMFYKLRGGIVCVWGVFQLFLAFRREDSEQISKQITTIVSGVFFIGIGFLLAWIRGFFL